ncbi:MAG TPA: excinuclease ABC subunit UvrC, partial [Desulfobacteria bacterium]|nr:excinuclease ABC subunit UvrC [Desulfobacteria bacterium]
MNSIDRTDSFPAAPGVYLMKGTDGVILYVGKARNLRQRVRSYFRQSGDSRYHIQFLMARVADIDYIVTDTEKEALILENTLIKQHRPRYNFNLRDDKTYFSLRMDMREEFPRLSIVRKVPRDGARYFGPYSSASAAREVLRELYKIFPLRHYPLETCRRRGRPCLFYQIRQCSAPCHGLISPEDYAALAEGAALFLEGKSRELLKVFTARMAAAAGDEKYEEAARFRNLIRSVEVTVERQKMISRGGDTDVVGICRSGNRLEIALLFIRGGSMIGSRSYSLAWELDDAEGVASFINEFYSKEVFIPQEVLLPLPLPEQGALAELLSEQRGTRVAVTFPRRGVKAELVALACRNATSAEAERNDAAVSAETTLRELVEKLHLPTVPHRIECYDISNIGGRHAVGSRVVFSDGEADKQLYRHYRIRDVGQQDDFGMMREVLARRFRAGTDDGLPDLIVVDGGIGQLNVLVRVLQELDVEGVAAAALAKSRVARGMGKTEIERSNERIFLPGRKNPVVLRQNSAPLLLLARIRDEAHRFAITYHKKLRGKSVIASELGEIAGVGEKRRKALLRHFGSLKRLREATVAELLDVKGMTRHRAAARELGRERDS